MIVVQKPKGLREIIECYGNPDIDGDYALDKLFVSYKLDYFDLAYPLRIAWRPIQKVNRILAHVDVGASMVDALKEISEYKGHDYLVDCKFDYFGGVFNFRKMRGQDFVSTHSWGISIDMNPHIAPFHKPSKQPQFIIDAFVKRGFQYGGNWKNPDGMHFQACWGY